MGKLPRLGCLKIAQIRIWGNYGATEDLAVPQNHGRHTQLQMLCQLHCSTLHQRGWFVRGLNPDAIASHDPLGRDRKHRFVSPLELKTQTSGRPLTTGCAKIVVVQ